ncbi:MAG: DUF411 domain-containing protein [Hyphomicrobiales bacterium]|nr:MAG: DUF411 domain-containing protein [Hyphomicrobiales bacterium]
MKFVRSTRRIAVTRQVIVALAVLMSLPQAAIASSRLDVFTTSGCSCCFAWIKRMRAAGFTLTVKDVAMGELIRIKLVTGIPATLVACHTAKLGDYVIEGHVPVREIHRLLDERPDAIGLAVPGMPIGSPGMESGNKVEAYTVLLVKKDGSTEIYASYPATE